MERQMQDKFRDFIRPGLWASQEATPTYRRGGRIMPESGQSRGVARALEPTQGQSLAFAIEEQIEQLREEPYWQSGRNGKTLVHYDDFRVVLTTMQANTAIHEHKAAGRIAVETMEGHLRVHASGREHDLPAGHLLVLDRVVPYDIEAVDDSAFLLFVAWPGEEQ
jgi:quercetin dioxygenase-like cupin family protein